MKQPTTLEQFIEEILEDFGYDIVNDPERTRIFLQSKPKQALLSLFEKYGMECVPEKFEPVMDSEGDKYLTDTKDGWNRAVDEQTARLKQIVKGTQDTQ